MNTNQQHFENEIFRGKECSYGKKAVKLLNEKHIDFEDHVFPTDQAEERFKKEEGVETTPQIYLHGERIGGFDALASELGVAAEVDVEDDSKTYVPVIAVFGITGLASIAASLGFMGFMGLSLSALAMLKFMDLEGFKKDFEKYDLITKRVPFYAYVYPFAELAAGLGMLSGFAPTFTGIIAAFAGLEGGMSVAKAVWFDGKDLNCACVGGGSKAPLGFVSFTENAMMLGMGLYLAGIA